MPQSPDPIHFAPPEHAIDALIAALIDPAQSLAHVAATHTTTADALALWLARPDIARRMRTHESAHATRLRLTATTQLSHALETVTKILTDYNAIQSPRGHAGADVVPDHTATHTASQSSDSSPARPSESPVRAAETACRAASLLLRLARYYPAPQPREPLFAEHSAAPQRAKSYYDTPYQSRAAQAAGVSYYADNASPSSAQAAPASERSDDAPAPRTSPHHTTADTNNPAPAPAPLPDPFDQDLPLDIEDDLDLGADLDFDSDPDFNLDLNPSELATLPDLLHQVRQLTAAGTSHPP